MIIFKYNRSNIAERSMEDLTPLAEFLIERPRAVFEVGNHSDARASKMYSKCLTCQRAKEVRKELIKRGVHPDQLITKGYWGDSSVVPMTPIKLMSKKWQEKAHQRNRRTELKVVSTDRKMNVLNIVEFWNKLDSSGLNLSEKLYNDTLKVSFNYPESYRIYNKAYDGKIEIEDGKGFVMFIIETPVKDRKEIIEHVKSLSITDSTNVIYEIPELRVKLPFKSDSLIWARNKVTSSTNDLGEANYVLYYDEKNRRLVWFSWLDTHKGHRRKKLSQFIEIIKNCNFN